MNKLINLRHLYANVHSVSLISGIGNLSNLQELGNFQVGSKDGHNIKELNGLNELSGKLCISNLGHCSSKDDAQQANLKSKSHLETLQLKDIISEEILEGLQPHPNLKNLEIANFCGAAFPKWMVGNMAYFRNLQSLYLKSHPRLTRLPPLGQIKKLKFLILENIGLKKIGEELYGEPGGAFPSLEELTLAHMSNLTQWENWSADEGQEFFPFLSKLQIIDCKCLESIPDLSLVSSLEELRIQECDQLSSSIHEYIGSLDSLRVLDIDDHPLTESLDFPEQSALEKYDQLSSPIPEHIGSLDSIRARATMGNPRRKLDLAMRKRGFHITNPWTSSKKPKIQD